jgi:hypothetical protein
MKINMTMELLNTVLDGVAEDMESMEDEDFLEWCDQLSSRLKESYDDKH